MMRYDSWVQSFQQDWQTFATRSWPSWPAIGGRSSAGRSWPQRAQETEGIGSSIVAGVRPLLAAAALAVAACQPQLQLEPTPRPAASGGAVVVVTEGGALPTKPVPRTPSPTPTTDIVLRINTVIAFPTRTPVPPGTPSPTVGPPPTSTPRPSPTRMILSGPPIIPSATPSPRPTRTRRDPVDPIEMEETRVAALPSRVAAEPDYLEPNDAEAQAEILGVGGELDELTMHQQSDVDVFAIPLDGADADMVLVVTLNARTLGRYRLELRSPTRPNAGRIRFDGTTAMRAVADVGNDTGTYYAFVRTVGAVLPEGPYSISACLVAPAPTPTVTP